MLIDKILKNIIKISDNKEICIVWISGLDASGKSQIWKELQKKLNNLGKNCYYTSGDSFQFDLQSKNTLVEKDWATQHMKHSINLEKMRDEFLIPLKHKKNIISVETTCYDNWEKSSEIIVSYPCIYIIESIYLFRNDITPFLDYKIFLDITEETCLKRCYNRARDHEFYGDNEGIRKKYEKKNFPGYRLFMKEQYPKSWADIIIDNNDYDTPRIIYEKDFLSF